MKMAWFSQDQLKVSKKDAVKRIGRIRSRSALMLCESDTNVNQTAQIEQSADDADTVDLRRSVRKQIRRKTLHLRHPSSIRRDARRSGTAFAIFSRAGSTFGTLPIDKEDQNACDPTIFDFSESG